MNTDGPDPLIETLQWQFRMAWSLASEHHLPRVTDEACLWMPHGWVNFELTKNVAEIGVMLNLALRATG